MIGKESNCGIILGFIFILSFFLLLINNGLFFLIILSQAVIIFLDASKIKTENNNIGPNPFVYGILAIIIWIIIVPIYIYNRAKYADYTINSQDNGSYTNINQIPASSEQITTSPNLSDTIVIPNDNLQKIDVSSISSTITDDKNTFNQDITWLGDFNEIQIKNYVIPNPLIYLSKNSIENCEASCIQLNLPIGNPVDELKGSLGYWPKYLSINPDQRATYLDWLSKGRSQEISDIGYVFLFFYGLEYRALIEKEDIPVIIKEVNDLLKKFPDSGSLNTYLTSFLAYVAAQQISNITDENFSQFFSNLSNLTYDQVLVLLAWYIKQNKPITWEIAYSLAKMTPETPKSVIIKKLPREFKQLFETKFKLNYPNGMEIEPSVRNYKFEYRPASPSLLPYYQNYLKNKRIESVEISNPLGKKSQFKNIFSIWTETIEELKPASRKVSNETQNLSAKAYEALPASLKQDIDHPEKTKWNQVITEYNTEENGIIIPIYALATLINMEKRDRLTPTQSKLLFSIAQDVGYIIIPDPRITGKPFLWDELITVYPLPDKKNSTSELYPSIAFILELGMSIALADKTISQEEMEHLDRFIFGSFKLSPLDIECLKQYQQILIQTPPSLERLGTRLKEHLTDNNKLIVAEYLRDMAMADGILHSNEYKALNKIYKSMGLKKDNIQVLFPSELTSYPSEQPIQIIQSSSTRIGEVIKVPTSVEPTFILNRDLIEKKISDSNLIKEIISEMNEKEIAEISENIVEPLIVSDKTISSKPNPLVIQEKSSKESLIGLHSKYAVFLKEILLKNEFSKPQLQKISQNYGFMLGGAIEDINTWSEEKYGDILFYEIEDTVISINSDVRNNIMEELK